jgi:hypothetical protein
MLSQRHETRSAHSTHRSHARYRDKALTRHLRPGCSPPPQCSTDMITRRIANFGSLLIDLYLGCDTTIVGPSGAPMLITVTACVRSAASSFGRRPELCTRSHPRWQSRLVQGTGMPRHCNLTQRHPTGRHDTHASAHYRWPSNPHNSSGTAIPIPARGFLP